MIVWSAYISEDHAAELEAVADVDGADIAGVTPGTSTTATGAPGVHRVDRTLVTRS
jgi:hypothetical protein